GIALREEGYASAGLGLLGCGRGKRQRHKRIMRMRVAPGKLAAAGEGGAPAHRNVGVLAQEQRFKAARLECASKLVDCNCVIGGKMKSADKHHKTEKGLVDPAMNNLRLRGHDRCLIQSGRGAA